MIIGIILLIIQFISLRYNNNFPLKKNSNSHFAFLIPARYESKVIESLLISIKKQTVKVNMQDVYVIVESMLDETVAICQKYNVSVVLRTTKRPRKGYALDEAIKQIKKYDLYFIFDADNVLDENYLKEMLKTYKLGYDIGIGYRNCKNGNANIISACSSLTFSMINTLGNKIKNKYSANMIISGTGFYIKGEILHKLGGFPFNSLTEDYEFSLYSIACELTSYYNDKATFYDEQPTKYNVTVKQRKRWIRGYFDSRKKYLPFKITGKNKGSKINEMIGVTPYIFIIISFLFKINLNNIILSYLVMMLITIVMILKEKLDLNLKMKIKVILFNPIYLVTYIPCALLAILKKEITWDRIDHG